MAALVNLTLKYIDYKCIIYIYPFILRKQYNVVQDSHFQTSIVSHKKMKNPQNEEMTAGE